MSTVKNCLQKKYSITLDKIKFRCLKNLVPYGIKTENGNAKQAVVMRILLKSRMRTTFQVEWTLLVTNMANMNDNFCTFILNECCNS